MKKKKKEKDTSFCFFFLNLSPESNQTELRRKRSSRQQTRRLTEQTEISTKQQSEEKRCYSLSPFSISLSQSRNQRKEPKQSLQSPSTFDAFGTDCSIQIQLRFLPQETMENNSRSERGGSVAKPRGSLLATRIHCRKTYARPRYLYRTATATANQKASSTCVACFRRQL